MNEDAGVVDALRTAGQSGDRVVLPGWKVATAGTPTVDVAWLLPQDRSRAGATHDRLEAGIRAAARAEKARAEEELEPCAPPVRRDPERPGGASR